MSTPRRWRKLSRLLAVVALCPATALAQAPGDSTGTTGHSHPRIAGWISLGLGGGQGKSGGFGVVAAGNASIGALLLTYRESDFGPFIAAGDGVRDHAVLVGVRSRWPRLFASAALGYGEASQYHQCDQCGVTTVDPAVSVMAYDVRLHANYFVPGLAISWSGVSGPARVRYDGITVALELGWFGR